MVSPTISSVEHGCDVASASSSSYSITMAATPIRMLKWASRWLNSRLLSIATTAGMTGESKVTNFLYLRPYLAGKLTITAWSPNGDRQITRGWSTDNRPISRHQPEIDGTPGGHRWEPWWSPAGDRQVIADRVIRAVQGQSKSADELPIWKSGNPEDVCKTSSESSCIVTSA